LAWRPGWAMVRDMSDCFALVTGTSSGIGAAVAAQLLGRGWTVAGLARRTPALAHPRYRHLALDLHDVAGLEAAIEHGIGPLIREKRWQRVGLVNNAADGGVLGPVESLDPAALVQLYAVNVAAPTWLMGFIVSQPPNGVAIRIVNVSSGAAVRPFGGLASYASTKAALRMAGMVLGVELDSPLRRGTAILSYEPGIVDTPMQAAARSRTREEFPWAGIFHDFAASGRLVSPDEPAREIAAFLESDDQPRFTERRLGA
jgi:benzil reductase ((S)-benzoin forming)